MFFRNEGMFAGNSLPNGLGLSHTNAQNTTQLNHRITPQPRRGNRRQNDRMAGVDPCEFEMKSPASCRFSAFCWDVHIHPLAATSNALLLLPRGNRHRPDVLVSHCSGSLPFQIAIVDNKFFLMIFNIQAALCAGRGDARVAQDRAGGKGWNSR
jgi:hypothetical protein